MACMLCAAFGYDVLQSFMEAPFNNALLSAYILLLELLGSELSSVNGNRKFAHAFIRLYALSYCVESLLQTIFANAIGSIGVAPLIPFLNTLSVNWLRAGSDAVLIHVSYPGNPFTFGGWSSCVSPEPVNDADCW